MGGKWKRSGTSLRTKILKKPKEITTEGCRTEKVFSRPGTFYSTENRHFYQPLSELIDTLILEKGLNISFSILCSRYQKSSSFNREVKAS